jgi:hypothetical protein
MISLNELPPAVVVGGCVVVVVAVCDVGVVVPVGFVAVGAPVVGWVPVAVGVVAPGVVATSGAPQADTSDSTSTRTPSAIAQYLFFMFVLLLYSVLYLTFLEIRLDNGGVFLTLCLILH